MDDRVSTDSPQNKDPRQVIRVADYVVQQLVQFGIQHAFLITGGGAMHLNDAFGKNPAIQCVFNHHEQACAIAADGYYRASNRMPVVNVTSGPGGTNAMTGVYGAWTDSVPMLVISGQVKYETCAVKYHMGLRQLGDQEVDIIALVTSITKYSALVADKQEIRYHLEKALHYATEGRPGPVWLDIPLDVQGAMVDETTLPAFTPPAAVRRLDTLEDQIDRLIARLAQAERPVVMLGSGVAISQTREEVLHLLDRLPIPVVTAWNAHYLVPDHHPGYVGRPGTVGDRAGNIAVQNADLLLVLGCRLNIRQISYDWKSFADRAFKVMVDIDDRELNKPTLAIDLKIHGDLRDFLAILHRKTVASRPSWSPWLAWCRAKRARYPVVEPAYYGETLLNPYVFMKELSARLPDHSVTVCANGSACVMSFQAFIIKNHQRLFTNSGCAAMGYDLPAAIGACLARHGEQTVCLAGDGSIMMNLQELQTIVSYRLPIKIFLINNCGYHSISQTQHAYFPDSLMGFNPATGVHFPDFGKLAAGFDLAYRRIATLDDCHQQLDAILATPGPVLCEVVVNPQQIFSPKLSSRKLADGTMVSARLENMYPFLSDDEMAGNDYPHANHEKEK